jgi:hypothetical protein
VNRIGRRLAAAPKKPLWNAHEKSQNSPDDIRPSAPHLRWTAKRNIDIGNHRTRVVCRLNNVLAVRIRPDADRA